MYKLFYFRPDSHMSSDVVGIKDDDGKITYPGFRNQEDAFDYIKKELENDTYYKAFVSNPDIYIKEIYDELNDYNKKIIQKCLVDRYRGQCMSEYFNKE